MRKGLIFDIKEFTIHDGPGIRTTIFLKGCPLSCMWCHNPEGQLHLPQTMHHPGGDRVAGEFITSEELAKRINRQAAILQSNNGGVTFSGGEPLMQCEFIAEVIDQLDNIHVVLDTCGQGDKNDFMRLLERVDLVYYDLKLIDPEMHLKYTGIGNTQILANLRTLSESGVPFVIRIPLIPSITDTFANLTAIASTIHDLPGLLNVDLLPYNLSAGAKYQAAGMNWRPDYNEEKAVNADLSSFLDLGVKVFVK